MQGSSQWKRVVDQVIWIRALTFWATRKVSLRIPCSNRRDFWSGKKAKMSGWQYLSEPFQAFNSLLKWGEIKPCCWPLPTFDWVNSRKLAARPSSSVSLSVFMATFKMWIGSSWTLWMTKQIHIFILRYTIIQVNDQPVTSRGLFLSPCCPLHHKGQDYLPLGRLDLGEGSRRSSSTRLLYSCRGGKKKKNQTRH